MQLWPDRNRFVGMGSKVLFLLLTTVILAGSTAAQDAVRDAEQVLRVEKHLRHLAGGTVWLSQAERDVRQCLTGLEKARREIIRKQQGLDERIRRNLVRWEASQRRIVSLQTALASSEADQADKRKIRKQIDELKSQSVAPNQLAAQADIRSNLIKLTNSRHGLALRLLKLQRLVPTIDPQYARLTADRDVQAALRALGPAHRLGPLSDGYDNELKRLGDCESEVFTPWIPAYLQSGRVRVGAIVNESIPVTFTWRDSNDPAVLTASMAESVGLGQSEREKQTIPITMGRGRRVPAYRATIPALRFGQYVLRDVSCFVLPPEAEDLGAQIGIDAFSEYETRVEIEKLRLVIRAQHSESPGDTKER